jgi:hypothetical protein
MQHLTLEALARLLDEPAEADEALHLRGCLTCRRELEALRAQTALLGALDDPEPAPETWPALEARLRAEGLLADRPSAVRPAVWYSRPALRAAAVAAVFFLGGAAGVALVRGGGAGTVARGTLPAATARYEEPVVSPVELASSAAAEGALPGEPLIVIDETEPAAAAGVRLASEGGGRTVAAAPFVRTRPARPALPPAVAAAERELAEAEAAYLGALDRYARLADPASGADPLTRLAALERLLAATGAALERSPDDPVINGYHLAALRERNEVRRQIAKAQKDTWF